MTPATLAAAYDLMKTTLPFRCWKLPKSADVTFRVNQSTVEYGACYLTVAKKIPVIRVSARSVKTIPQLLEVMAHEMIHLHEDTQHKARSDVSHSALFRRYAKQVCRHHHFDMEFFL